MEAKSFLLGNIENIKSKFITIQIFSFIWENRKLDILKYSRKNQTKLKINLDNYKNLSQRYKTRERNGKGQEYLKYYDPFGNMYLIIKNGK